MQPQLESTPSANPLFEDPNLAPGQSGLSLTPGENVPGVGLSADSGIGVSDASAPVARPSPRDEVKARFDQMPMLQKIGTALGEFGAGVQGRPSPLRGQVEEERKNRLLKVAEAKESVTALDHGVSVAQKLSGEAKEAFIKDYAAQLDETSPGLGKTFGHLAAQPGLLADFQKYMPYLPEPMKLLAKDNPGEFIKTIGKDPKALEDARQQYLLKSGTDKARLTMGSVKAHPEALVAAGVPQELIDAFTKQPSASTFGAINDALPGSSPSKLNADEMLSANQHPVFHQSLGMLSPAGEEEVTKSGLKKADAPAATEYTNVQQTPNGSYIGLSKKTGQMEVIPMGKGTSEATKVTPDSVRAAGAMIATGMPVSQAIPGYGKQATAERQAARSAAIDLIKGENPAMSTEEAGRELANRTIDFAAGKKSVGQLTTMLGASRQAVDQLDFNVKKVTEQMDKLPSSDLSPVINAIARGAEKWTGDPAYSSLFFFMHASAMESARLLQGGQASIAQLHQGAAEEAKKWADANYTTPKAWKEGVAPAMLAEGAERIKTYERAIAKQRPSGPAVEAPKTNEAYTEKFGKPPPSIGNKDGFEKLKSGEGYIDSRDGQYKIKG